MDLTALCVAVCWCLMAPCASRDMLVVLSSPPAVLSLCLRRQLAGCLQYQLPFVVSPPPTVSVCPSPALVGQVVWTHSCDPSCCSCVLSYRGVSGAAFCCLGLLSHPLLQGSSLEGSSSWVVQAPGVFLDYLLGFFPLASSVC